MPEKFTSGPLDTEPAGPYESWPGLEEIAQEPSRVPKTEPRPMPTPEMAERMDKELVTLGNLMHDSGIWWQLDGALNVSAMKGEYIGLHADVDISVVQDDIPKLEEYLSKSEYRLFLLKKEGEKKIYKRAAAKDFNRNDVTWRICIAAVDEHGAIRQDADLPVIDVAVIERDKEGHALGWKGVRFPERWIDGKTVEFRGAVLNLSTPARFLFNKVWFTRAYDMDDIKKLAETGELTEQDIAEVDTVITPILKDFENDKDTGKGHADMIRDRMRQIAGWVRSG